MHKSYFNQVRRTVLRRSRYILQDDSGIAMKYFQKGAWQFNYYGTYRRPINLFAKQYQPALTAAYRDTLHRPKALPFGTEETRPRHAQAVEGELHRRGRAQAHLVFLLADVEARQVRRHDERGDALRASAYLG